MELADTSAFTRSLVALSFDLAGTPCGPLDKGHGFPDREVEAIVAATLAG